ncbi:hypothetical protein Tco_1203986 [Tanacetum coccineum]
MGDENPIRTLGDYSKPSHEGYRNSIELPAGNNVVPLRSDTIRLVQNRCSFHRLGSEDPNQHLMDFLKLVDSLDLDSENKERTRITSDRRLIELENQVQRLIEAHFALTQPTYVNKITTPCEICSGTDDTQYCMENTEQAFVEYASSRTDKAGAKWYTFKPEQNNFDHTYNSSWRSHSNLRLSKFEANFKQQQSKMTNKIDTVLKAITDRIAGTLPIDTVKNLKLGTHPIILKDDNSQKDEPEAGVQEVKYYEIFPTSSIIDPRLSQVVLGRPFVEISNMNHDPPKGVVRFINGTDEVSYKMPHKIEQYDSPSDLEKEHTKLVYLRNNKDKRRGVEYVMNKILGFYKECLELGLKYLRGMDDEGEVT